MRPTISPGTRVADRFTILRFLAEGGMGEVYEARDEILEEEVALKFLSRRNLGDEHLVRRFRREIQLARKVTHPNVCRIYDVFEHNLPVPGTRATVPVTFVSMEMLHGETLEDRLERGGRLTEDEALPMIVQMCNALAAAHDVGIVHRDFKSNNVMLHISDDGQPRVVVTDFGLARSMTPGDPSKTPLTVDQLILGTAEYMSPEQIQGEPVSPRSDLYALGVVIFEMVTGAKPYSAPNPMQLLVQRVSEPPARPRDFIPELSATWEQVILSCLEENPDDRPVSARDVVRGLGVDEPLVPAGWTPTPTATPGTPLPQPPRRRTRRRRRHGWIVVVVLALLAMITFWARAPRGDRPVVGVFAPQRLTTGLGLEMDPRPSPDGGNVAYAVETDDGTFALEVRRLDGEDQPRRLTVHDPYAFEPDWLDETRLVYHSASLGGLWSVHLENGRSERLTEVGSRPAVSPDRRRIAFQTDSSPLLSDTTMPARAPSTLGLIDIDSREVRALTSAGQPAGGHGAPAWAPDGRHLVFAVSRRSISEIWALRVDDAEPTPRPIVRDPATAYDPVVAADQRSVFFVSRDQEVKALWQVEVDRDLEPRGEPRQIAGLGLSSIRQPRLSADGKTLVYGAYLTRSNLWSLDLGSPEAKPVAVTSGTERYSRPVFSTDGRLAFDYWQLGIDIDIVELDLETGTRRQLTVADRTNTHAGWLPDGRLAYTSRTEDAPSVFESLDPETGVVERLFELGDREDWVVLSPDGTRVASHSDEGGDGLDIWIRDLPSGQPWRLTFHGRPAGFPTWSPDGTRVAYQLRVGEGSHLWIVSVDGGAPRPLVEAEGESWPHGWAPDGSAVAFAGWRDGQWDLYRVQIDDRTVDQLTRFGRRTGYVRYPTWSPTGDLLVFERAETAADLFVVRDFR